LGAGAGGGGFGVGSGTDTGAVVDGTSDSVLLYVRMIMTKGMKPSHIIVKTIATKTQTPELHTNFLDICTKRVGHNDWLI
jgi:hypothetical protein